MYRHVRLEIEGETVDEVFDKLIEHSQKSFLENPLKEVAPDLFSVVRSDGELLSSEDKAEMVKIARITQRVVLDEYLAVSRDLEKLYKLVPIEDKGTEEYDDFDDWESEDE